MTTGKHEPTLPEQTTSPTTMAPMVIFCSGCRTIVGDSYSWLGADVTLRTFTLYDTAESVIIKQDLVTSREGADVGSTYTEMICSGCDSILGRVYKTTPRSLDHMRDMYSFSVDQVTLYQLGPKRTSVTEFDIRLEEMLDIPSINNLQENMRKVQKVICHFHERLQPVEQFLSQIEASSLQSTHDRGDLKSTGHNSDLDDSQPTLPRETSPEVMSLTNSPITTKSHIANQSASSNKVSSSSRDEKASNSVNGSESDHSNPEVTPRSRNLRSTPSSKRTTPIAYTKFYKRR